LKIKRIEIKNFLGIKEFELDPGKINLISGPKGSTKSSIIEGIEKIFTNKNRRTEVIKHGEEEATLFIETTDGLEISRKIRADKADYFKIRKGDEGVPNTETYLRNFINGDVFRPVDWVNMKSEQQTKSILNMLQIDWTQDNVLKWFGEIPSNIEYEQHILMVLKAIEVKYFKDREELNRQIKELKTQVTIIKKDMPENYDGEVWRVQKVQDLYKIVSDAEKINGLIKEANLLQQNVQDQINTIDANADSQRTRVQMKYKDQRQDIKDIIEMAKNKIEKAKSALENVDNVLSNALGESENDFDKESYKIAEQHQNLLEKLKDEYNQKVKEAAEQFIADKDVLNIKKQRSKDSLTKLNQSTKEAEKDTIQLQETKIATKQQELISLDEIENQALEAVNVKKVAEIEKVELKVGKAAEYLKVTVPVEIEPLQEKADEVATMQSYLRLWDKMIEIRDNQLPSREQEAESLSSKIDKARTLPSELLKTAQMPVDGISVDEKGLIRINKTLIDGLSDGEKLELAMKIAKAQCGELKVICLDKFESLNPAVQQKLLEDIAKDEFQYFITSTMSDEFAVDKIS
jgi:energy-coupling factor transporter ATP-binding protein EcfA2